MQDNEDKYTEFLLKLQEAKEILASMGFKDFGAIRSCEYILQYIDKCVLMILAAKSMEEG